MMSTSGHPGGSTAVVRSFLAAFLPASELRSTPPSTWCSSPCTPPLGRSPSVDGAETYSPPHEVVVVVYAGPPVLADMDSTGLYGHIRTPTSGRSVFARSSVLVVAARFIGPIQPGDAVQAVVLGDGHVKKALRA